MWRRRIESPRPSDSGDEDGRSTGLRKTPATRYPLHLQSNPPRFLVRPGDSGLDSANSAGSKKTGPGRDGSPLERVLRNESSAPEPRSRASAPVPLLRWPQAIPLLPPAPNPHVHRRQFAIGWRAKKSRGALLSPVHCKDRNNRKQRRRQSATVPYCSPCFADDAFGHQLREDCGALQRIHPGDFHNILIGRDPVDL